jgi:hypothetical protein
MRDYLKASDLTHLPEEAIALYDDDTAKGERILHFGDREGPQAVATRIIEAEPTTPASTGAVERS